MEKKSTSFSSTAPFDLGFIWITIAFTSWPSHTAPGTTAGLAFASTMDEATTPASSKMPMGTEIVGVKDDPVD